MFYLILLFLILCFCFNKNNKNNNNNEGYLNHLDISYKENEINCPQIHANNYKKITQNYQMIQPFGYTKNDLLHMTRFTETDIPLPTDPDFFKHI